MVNRETARSILMFLKNPLARHQLEMPPEGMPHEVDELLHELRSRGITVTLNMTAPEIILGHSIKVLVFNAEAMHPRDAERTAQADRDLQEILDRFPPNRHQENLLKHGQELLRNTWLVDHSDLAYALHQYCFDEVLERTYPDNMQALAFCLEKFETKLNTML